MGNLLDTFNDLGADVPEPLQPARLGSSPTMVLLFTADATSTKLHYVEDQAVRAFVPCPGKGCPLCYVGSEPEKFELLPVFNIRTKAIEVLRVSHRRGPGTLASQILPHLLGDGMKDKMFVITRDGAVHRVDVQVLGDHADRGVATITAFAQAQEEGLCLTSAFPEYSAQELAEVVQVRRMLDAMGGWSTPEGGDAP